MPACPSARAGESGCLDSNQDLRPPTPGRYQITPTSCCSSSPRARTWPQRVTAARAAGNTWEEMRGQGSNLQLLVQGQATCQLVRPRMGRKRTRTSVSVLTCWTAAYLLADQSGETLSVSQRTEWDSNPRRKAWKACMLPAAIPVRDPEGREGRFHSQHGPGSRSASAIRHWNSSLASRQGASLW